MNSKPLHCAWYYDWTEDRRLSEDPAGESILCWLCDDCARTFESIGWVSHASEDQDYDYRCWACGRAYQDDKISDEFFDLLPHTIFDDLQDGEENGEEMPEEVRRVLRDILRCGDCGYVWSRDASPWLCPNCLSSRVRLAYPEACSWDPALLRYTTDTEDHDER